MFNRIKNYRKQKKEYREARKALTLLIMNQYSDLLTAEQAAKTSEKDAYEAMEKLGKSVNLEQLKDFMDNISRIAGSPELTTQYYQQVSAQAHEQRMLELEQGK